MVHDPRDPDMRLVLFSEEASTAPELPAAALTLLEEMAGEAGARAGARAGAGPSVEGTGEETTVVSKSDGRGDADGGAEAEAESEAEGRVRKFHEPKLKFQRHYLFLSMRK